MDEKFFSSVMPPHASVKTHSEKAKHKWMGTVRLFVGRGLCGEDMAGTSGLRPPFLLHCFVADLLRRPARLVCSCVRGRSSY